MLSVPDREETRLAEAAPELVTVSVTVLLGVVDWETDVVTDCELDGVGIGVKMVFVMVGLVEGERELVALLKPDTVMDTE